MISSSLQSSGFQRLLFAIILVQVGGCAHSAIEVQLQETHCTYVDRDANDPAMWSIRFDDDKVWQLHIPADAEVIIDGQISSPDQVQKGMNLVLTIRDKTVIKVEAKSPE